MAALRGPIIPSLDEPVLTFARKDFTSVRQSLTVQEALDTVRQKGVGERVFYFYVVDDEDRLVGVVPTRRLLISAADKRLSDIMERRVVTIPQQATVMEACEFFIMHKLLAFPVVDDERRIFGIVDVNLFAQEVFDIAERESVEKLFDAIGFRISLVRDASPAKAFRYRFPWLIATMVSGVTCAFLAGVYETTLAQSIILAFFLALLLGLGESVSIQTLSVTIPVLHAVPPTLGWFVHALTREILTALLLGLACATTVGAIVVVWRGFGLPALVIGASILMSVTVACLTGLAVPSLMHWLKLDPKIASGPVALALADIFTLVVYFTMAHMLLG